MIGLNSLAAGGVLQKQMSESRCQMLDARYQKRWQLTDI
jgi:hypothetical protein